MRAVVYDRPGQWDVREVADPEPGPGDVLLAVELGGVCGTDVHLHHGEFGPTYPLTPGHEIVGRVERVGDGVSLPTGGLVAVDNMTTCGHCAPCRAGRRQYCLHWHARGVSDPGGFAQLIVVPAENCFDVGDLPAEAAVLAEPAACVVHGIDVLSPPPGVDALVIGTGPTGLIMAQLLADAGAGRVSVAGRTPFKLELASELGADETVRLDPADPGGDERRLAALAPDGFDVVVDATGSPEILGRCQALLAVGGTLFVYGMTPERAELVVSPYDIFRRELRIIGSFSQPHCVDRAVDLLTSRRLRTEGLITHRFALADYGDAIETVAHDSQCLKAVVVP